MTKFHTVHVVGSGWSDWENPIMTGYKMACCDCGLVHDMEFQVLKITETLSDGTWSAEEMDSEAYRIGMRAKRNNRSTGQMRRKHK